MLRIAIDKIKSVDDKKFFEEKIGNRIVLNFLYTLTAYVMLFILYRYATGFGGTRINVIEPTRKLMVVLFAVFALGAVAFYIWSVKIKDFYKKSSVRNHAHMLVLFAAGMFIVNMQFYLKIFFPVESISGTWRTITSPLRNPMKTFPLVGFLMALIFIGLMIYNFVIYRKVSKLSKKSIAKNK